MRSWSVSSVRGFHTCQLQWWFRRSGVAEEFRPVALIEGTVLHATLAFHLRSQMSGTPPSESEAIEVLDATWFAEECGSPAPIEFGRLDRGQTLERLRGLYRHWRAKAPIEGTILAVEEEIRVPLQGIELPMLGYADLVVAGEDGDQVIDFKTSAARPSPDEFLGRFDLQRLAMTRGWEAARERQVASWCWIHLVKTKEPQVVASRLTVPPADRAADLARLAAVVNPTILAMADVLEGRRSPIPTQAVHAMCGGCPYRGPCARFAGSEALPSGGEK